MQYQSTEKKGFFTTLKSHLQYTTAKYDESSNFFVKWAPSLLSAAGLLISWEFSTMIGFAFGMGGFMYGVFSKNSVNKTISTVVGGITMALSFLFM